MNRFAGKPIHAKERKCGVLSVDVDLGGKYE